MVQKDWRVLSCLPMLFPFQLHAQPFFFFQTDSLVTLGSKSDAWLPLTEGQLCRGNILPQTSVGSSLPNPTPSAAGPPGAGAVSSIFTDRC